MLAFAILAIATLLPLASASAIPLSCGAATIPINTALVRGGVYDGTCEGAAVYSPAVACTFSPINHGPIHVYVLAGSGCTTGVIIT